MGSLHDKLLSPIRLQWSIPDACQQVIESSLRTAQAIADDVDMHLEVVRGFGKGVMKKCRISPDAFIQLSLQLAYYRVTNPLISNVILHITVVICITDTENYQLSYSGVLVMSQLAL